LHARAVEEQLRIREDMANAIQWFCEMHAKLVSNAVAASSLSVEALFNKQIFQLETSMADLWHVCARYIGNLTPMPQMMLQDVDVSYMDEDNILDLDDIILHDTDDVDLIESSDDM
jgi:hypothetical protein